MEQENQIYRLTFDVDLPASIGEDNALAEAESCCETYIVPTVDEVLSRFEGYSIAIERVDLDLGTLKKDEIPRVLRGLLEDEIVKRLYQDSETEQFSIGEGRPHKAKNSSEPEWISYLYTGILPWSVEDSGLELSEQLKQEVFSHLVDRGWMASFFGRLSTDGTAIYRFLNLFDADTIRDLLSAPFFAEALKKEVQDVLTPQKLKSLDKHQLLALSYTLIKGEELNEEQIKAARIDQGMTYKVKEQQLMMSDEEVVEHCLVDDAGLVILHPFLPALFERVGYLNEERKFISLAMQERAVHLLRWLAGFDLPRLDYQLLLEKVLCDLPLNYPIDSEIELTDLEKEEGMQVLKSVCQYWRPLNGTSPEGLQHSFLQRQGSIAYEDHNWIVRVEGQTLDILLDDLPWEISLLLLPWKEEMIIVEWQRE